MNGNGHRIGVDVGGTFTDFVLFDRQAGTYSVYKTSTTPDDQSVGILRGLEDRNIPGTSLATLAHGTTVTTNAVIERKGSKTALLCTSGFRDILKIRRTTRGELYNIQWEPPEELIPRSLRKDIEERTDGQGNVLVPVNTNQVKQTVVHLTAQGVEAIAVAYLNSYLNPANERATRDAIREQFPDLPVYLSSDTLPAWREFDRTVTTAVAAYVGPVLRRYLESLETRLNGYGYGHEVLVMLSNGGLTSSRIAREIPGYSLVSGPAAGVAAAGAISQAIGDTNVVAMDIGGTSTDIAVIADGQMPIADEQVLEFGTEVDLAVVDVVSIGCGGGTLASVDIGGRLHVGPESAGAVPGPASYGRGGTVATLTDANVVAGYLATLLGGDLELDAESATAAVEAVGQPLGLEAVEAALGVIEVGVHNIADAIRQRTVERGRDPREFALFAYGGLGPLLGCPVARALGMSRVIVPPHPGVTSALGLLACDIRHDFVSTVMTHESELDSASIEAAYATLEQEAAARLDREGVAADARKFIRSADVRYAAQTHELLVHVPVEPFGPEALQLLREAFREAHQREHGYSHGADEPLEIVNVRLTAIGLLEKVDMAREHTLREQPGAALPEPTGIRLAHYARGAEPLETPVYDRGQLHPGVVVGGPAIIEQFDSTTLIPPGDRASADGYGNLIITLANTPAADGGGGER